MLLPGPLNSKTNPIKLMSIVSLIVTLVVVGLLLWLVNNYIPMDHKIKSILNIVVVIFVVLWLLSAFGIISGAGSLQVPKLN